MEVLLMEQPRLPVGVDPDVVLGFEVVAEATPGEEAVDLVDKIRPGVVLMDINMGAMGYVNKDEPSPRVARWPWEAGGDPAWLGRQV